MNKAMLDLRARLELMSKQYPMLSAVGAGIDKAIREIDTMLAVAPKPEAQAAGDGVTFWLIVRNGDVEFGQHLADLPTHASHDAQQPTHAVEAYKTMLAQAEADLRDARAALAQQPAVVGDFDEWYASYDGIGGPKNPEQLARDAWERAAALTPAATPGEGTVSASDWRDLYRLQTAMRYMDCDAGLTRETAYSMADADIGRIEALAQKEGNGNG